MRISDWSSDVCSSDLMASFLRGYAHYCRSDLPQQVRDRYFRETACVAEALGARDVPRSAADVDAFFAAQQSRLHFSSRSREVRRVLAGLDLQLPGTAGLREPFVPGGPPPLSDRARSGGRGLGE